MLVALCVPQQASARAEVLAEDFPMVVWWAAQVEMRSAFARLGRSRQLPPAARIAALENLDSLGQSWREIHPVSAVRELAGQLLGQYPLSAADSLQLAAALVWCRNRPAGRTFICADERLSGAAAQAGFTVLRP